LETVDLLNVVVDSAAVGQWHVSIPNIDFELPMDLEIDGERRQIQIGSTPVIVEAQRLIVVDPQKWYLHESDFTKND